MSDGSGDFITLDGSRLVGDTRRLLAGMAWMLAWVEAGGRHDAVVAESDPINLGRELLEAIPRLVEAGQVELGALVDAVRQEILETAVAATFSERLRSTLKRVDAKRLREAVHTISSEIIMAQVALLKGQALERERKTSDTEGETPVVDRPAEVWEVEVDRQRLLRQYRRAQEPLLELVVALDQQERDTAGFGDVEPFSFGRWLLGGLVRLVDNGALTVAELEGALRTGERGGESRLSTPEDLARAVRQFDLELAAARVCLDEEKRGGKGYLRSKAGRAAAFDKFRQELDDQFHEARRAPGAP